MSWGLRSRKRGGEDAVWIEFERWRVLAGERDAERGAVSAECEPDAVLFDDSGVRAELAELKSQRRRVRHDVELAYERRMLADLF